jgi:hypothetical protein
MRNDKGTAMDRRSHKLRRRFRVIAARAALCALVFTALGFTGYRQAISTPDEGTASAQVTVFGP